MATIIAVRAYQKFISPYKGFSCAHKKLHKGDSCSQFFRQLVESSGTIKALPLFWQRLQECQLANLTLRSQIQEDENIDPLPKKRTRRDRSIDSEWCNFLSNCSDYLNCSGCFDRDDDANCDAPDCNSFTPDCSSMNDCSDCGSFGDCGGCSN